MSLIEYRFALEQLHGYTEPIKTEEINRNRLASDEEMKLNTIYSKVINSVTKFLLRLDPQTFNYSQVESLHRTLKELNNLYQHLFGGGQTISNEVISQIQGHYNLFTIAANQLLGTVVISSGNIENDMTQIEVLLQKAKIEIASIEDLKKDITKIKNEAEELLSSAKNAVQEVAVAKFGILFETEAKNHRYNSYWWLGAVVVLIAGTAALAGMMLSQEDEFIKTHEKLLEYPATMVVFIGLRLIIFSTLFIFISVAIKNYRACKHNQIINVHRQKALNTFETFVKSSDGNKTIKEAVLLEVTRTIFTNLNTGFGSNDNEAESATKFFEIIKGNSGS